MLSPFLFKNSIPLPLFLRGEELVPLAGWDLPVFLPFPPSHLFLFTITKCSLSNYSLPGALMGLGGKGCLRCCPALKEVQLEQRSRGNENTHPHKNSHPNVHSSVIHKRLKVETTQISISR